MLAKIILNLFIQSKCITMILKQNKKHRKLHKKYQTPGKCLF